MLELFNKADILNKKSNYCDNDNVAKELSIEYPNIPLDIVRYFFVKHSFDGEMIMRDLPNIDAHKISVNKICLTNEQLQDKNIIDYAPFANYDEPYKVDIEFTINWYKEDYFKNGTWSAPIIALKHNDKLFVIDGTTRFHHMLICLFNKFSFVNSIHEIYVLEEL